MHNVKPLVKWVGGKRAIMPEVSQRLPRTVDKYYEPFVGGGSVFLQHLFPNATIADANEKLIMMYTAVRDTPNAVISYLKAHAASHSESYYYQMRDVFNDTRRTKASVAALFIYLNRTGFNGLYRENAAGKLNVPFGKHVNPKIVDVDSIHGVSAALQGVQITCRSYKDTPVEKAFYYLDPPYHDTFTAYKTGGFGEPDQHAVAALCDAIDEAGGQFMVSNSDTELTRRIYAKYKIETIQARRSVSASTTSRGTFNEIIVTNY